MPNPAGPIKDAPNALNVAATDVFSDLNLWKDSNNGFKLF